MKIARLDNLSRQDNLFSGGEPDSHYEKRQKILVNNDYNFTANSATDITSIKDLNEFYNNDQFKEVGGFEGYRSSVENHYSNTLSNNWTGITEEEKTILSELFLVPLSNRQEVLNNGQTKLAFQNLISETLISRFDKDGFDNSILYSGATKENINTYLNNIRRLNLDGTFEGASISALTISASTYHGDGSNLTGITTENPRTDFDIVKSESDLPAPVGGVITFNKSYEINGTVTITNKLDLNGFYVQGRDAFNDKLVYTPSTGELFTGSNGGTVKLLTLSAPNGTAKLFNLNDTSGTKINIVRDCLISNCANVGDIEGYYITLFNLINYSSNSSGITYTDINHLFVDDVAWFDTNNGTYETYVGDFIGVQIKGGFIGVTGSSVGINVSGITSLTFGELIGNPFDGNGTYTTGNFSNEWTIDCPGIPLEGDKFATGFLKMEGNSSSTPLSQNQWTPLLMPTAVLDTDSSHRFIQHTGFTYAMQYKGIHDINASISITMGCERAGGNGTNDYEFVIVVDGNPIPTAVLKEELNGAVDSIKLVANAKMSTDSYFYVSVRNTEDGDDIRCVGAQIIAKA